MRILKWVLLTLAGVAAVILAGSLFLPSRAHVERSALIAAPPATVFGLVNGFHRYSEFSPWVDLDPAAKYSFSGPDTGVGAKMAWDSEKREAGHGRQEVVAVEPDKTVRIKLEFVGMGTADVAWHLAPQAAGTRATWAFDYDFGNNLLMRYVGLTFDGSVGRDYEKGLARLQKLAAAEAARPRVPRVTLSSADVTAQTLAWVAAESPAAKIGQTIGAAYQRIGGFMKTHALTQAGAPVAITSAWDGKTWKFDAGIPVAGAPHAIAKARRAAGDVHVGETYAGRALKAEYIGSYETTSLAYEKIDAALKEQGLERNGRPWEEYASDPGTTPVDQLVTIIYQPVK
ncbi:MAG: SRPBCC family protein [Steroidobacteraceae bacterium]